MTEEQVNALADKVREGVGLRQAIEASGLPERQTLLYLKKNYLALFKDAKREQREAAE